MSKFTCPKCQAVNEKNPTDPVGCGCCGFKGEPELPKPEPLPKLTHPWTSAPPWWPPQTQIWSWSDDDCAIQRFFKNNPGVTSVLMTCNCKRCTVWCSSDIKINYTMESSPNSGGFLVNTGLKYPELAPTTAPTINDLLKSDNKTFECLDLLHPSRYPRYPNF